MGETQATGSAAESRALNHLQGQGLRLIETNYHCKCGEIDLIMYDGDTLVFTEVRSRKSSQYGTAQETVTPAKQRKVIRTSQFYLQQKKLFESKPFRFDVIAINAGNLQWIKSAF